MVGAAPLICACVDVGSSVGLLLTKSRQQQHFKISYPTLQLLIAHVELLHALLVLAESISIVGTDRLLSLLCSSSPAAALAEVE